MPPPVAPVKVVNVPTVEIAGQTAGEPIEVKVVDENGTSINGSADHVQIQSTDPSRPATTTFQQDLTTAGQRNINLKWESTQQTIAVSVTLFVLSVCSYIIVAGRSDLAQAAFIFMTNIAFLVVGTYFQRTNHTKIGGVGQNEVGR